jgi:hypothetical protein
MLCSFPRKSDLSLSKPAPDRPSYGLMVCEVAAFGPMGTHPHLFSIVYCVLPHEHREEGSCIGDILKVLEPLP